MKFVEITHKDKYNNFVKAQTRSQFTQSWEWGEFQKEVDNLVYRYGVYDNDELIQVLTLIKHELPMGKSYFYMPRVQFTGNKIEIVKFVFSEIKKLAKEEEVLFLRFESVVDFKLKNLNLKIKKTIDVQPAKTLILDLEKSEEELLKEMHQKTRYNIRLAEKKRVEIFPISINDIDSEFENFWNLMRITKERDAFRIHDEEYYKKMLRVGFVKLYLAKLDNKVLAAAIVSFFGDTATYIHGASSDEFRNLMAPYLLQWEMIKAGKSRGCVYYDLYGISEVKWPGVTRFKKGFGGEEIDFAGTYDLVFSALWYNVYMLIRKIRRFKFSKK